MDELLIQLDRFLWIVLQRNVWIIRMLNLLMFVNTSSQILN